MRMNLRRYCEKWRELASLEGTHVSAHMPICFRWTTRITGWEYVWKLLTDPEAFERRFGCRLEIQDKDGRGAYRVGPVIKDPTIFCEFAAINIWMEPTIDPTRSLFLPLTRNRSERCNDYKSACSLLQSRIAKQLGKISNEKFSRLSIAR